MTFLSESQAGGNRHRYARGHDEGRPTPWDGLLKNVLRD